MRIKPFDVSTSIPTGDIVNVLYKEEKIVCKECLTDMGITVTI